MSLESTARFISILFSLFSLWAIYYLLLKEDSRISAFFGGLIFAVYPFFVFYSRVVLPDISSVSLIFIGIVFLYFWKNSNGKNWLAFIFSLIFASLSILVKPTAVFYFLPLIYIFFLVYGFSFLKKPSFYLYFILSIAPFIAWRWWIGHFPEGIPASDWLITSVSTSEGMKEIFMRPAFFRWIFYERIANLILGGYSIALLVIGLMKRPKKSFLLFTIAISALIYLFTFEGGNVQHDYYQIMILPTLAIFCGLGAGTILSEKKIFLNSFFSIIVIFSVMTFSFLFSYNQVKDFYSYNENFIKITNTIKLLTDPNVKVVTDTMGDTTMLYNIDRKGYPSKYMDFPQMKLEGMNYFVTYNKSTADEAIAEGFTVVFENDSFFLIKL
jgi:4-amino-4-deoxy-L-arabinose transferase-like glycosyltransferase